MVVIVKKHELWNKKYIKKQINSIPHSCYLNVEIGLMCGIVEFIEKGICTTVFDISRLVKIKNMK